MFWLIAVIAVICFIYCLYLSSTLDDMEDKLSDTERECYRMRERYNRAESERRHFESKYNDTFRARKGN